MRALPLLLALGLAAPALAQQQGYGGMATGVWSDQMLDVVEPAVRIRVPSMESPEPRKLEEPRLRTLHASRRPVLVVIAWVQGERVFPGTSEGVERAREFLSSLLPGTTPDGTPLAQASPLGEVLDLLEDPEIRRAMSLAMQASDESRPLRVTLLAGDDPTTLWEGERLKVPVFEPSCLERNRELLKTGEARYVAPCPSEIERYTVEKDETLADIAAKQETQVHVLLHLNERRFKPGAYKSVRSSGESFIVLSSSSLQGLERGKIARVLLHEVGHAGDDSDCDEDREGYGPDHQHWANELLTPSTAFTEGWAHWVSSQASISVLFDDLDAPARDRFFIEGPRRPDTQGYGGFGGLGSSGGWTSIRREDLFLNDLHANEAEVFGILRRLQALPPGAEGIWQAFAATQEVPCRSLTVLVWAYVRLYPDQREAARDLLFPPGEYGRPPASTLDGILESAQLPYCQSDADLSRSRLYVPAHLGADRRELAAREFPDDLMVYGGYGGGAETQVPTPVPTEPVPEPTEQELRERETLGTGQRLQTRLRSDRDARDYLRDYPWDLFRAGLTGCRPDDYRPPVVVVPRYEFHAPGAVRDQPGGLFGLPGALGGEPMGP